MSRMVRPREMRPVFRQKERDHALRMVEAIAARTQVTIDEIVAPSADQRHDRFQLRAMSAWLIRHVDRLPYGQIALVIGASGHSHARYLVQRGGDLRDADLVVRALTDSIMGEHA